MRRRSTSASGTGQPAGTPTRSSCSGTWARESRSAMLADTERSCSTASIAPGTGSRRKMAHWSSYPRPGRTSRCGRSSTSPSESEATMTRRQAVRTRHERGSSADERVVVDEHVRLPSQTDLVLVGELRLKLPPDLQHLGRCGLPRNRSHSATYFAQPCASVQ